MKNLLVVFLAVMMAMLVGCASSNTGFYNGIASISNNEVVEAKGIPAPVVIAEAPAPAPEIIKIASIYEAILFPFDSTEITMDEHAKLVKIADMMNEYPATVVVIEGFASKEGTSEYNLILSANRAESVKTELIQMGVDPDSIMSVEGKGETEEFDFTALSPNRRVIVVTIN